MSRLQGKVALVTASSQGLGRACAEMLAREGARVVINGRRPDELAKTAQEIRQVMALRDADVHTMAGDVSNPDDVTRLIKATITKFGQLDILINNGGGPPPGKFVDLDEAAWQQALDSTLWPVVRLIRQCLPHLRAANERYLTASPPQTVQKTSLVWCSGLHQVEARPRHTIESRPPV